MLGTVHKNSFVSTFRFSVRLRIKWVSAPRWARAQKFRARLIDELLDYCSTLMIPASAHDFTAISRDVVSEYLSRFARRPPIATYCLLSLALSSSVLVLRSELVLSHPKFQIENGLWERFPPKSSPKSRANRFFFAKNRGSPTFHTEKSFSRTSLLAVHLPHMGDGAVVRLWTRSYHWTLTGQEVESICDSCV